MRRARSARSGCHTPAAQVQDPSECGSLTVLDAAAGIFDIVEMPNAGSRSEWRLHARAVRGDSESALLSIEDDGDYALVGRIRREGPGLLVWLVRSGAFSEDVTAGRLPGRHEDGDEDGDVLWLGPLDAAAVARIEQDEADRYFDWRRPILYIKVEE